MYSILPASVAILFLFYGFYVAHTKGLNRTTTAFVILCVTTFFWQFTWAILFQVNDPAFAEGLITVGWLLILFLPTSLYQFLAEITGCYRDLKYVYTSYIIAGLFAISLMTTNFLIAGMHDYFFGFYPKAGILHPLHVLQTCLVVTRGLYITYQKYRVVQAGEKTKLKYCLVSILIYFFAAVDYLCNYGIMFYPPGVIFITISLGIMTLATAQYHVMDNSRMIASSIAHEMRTPLATLTAQANILSEYLPTLVANYEQHTKTADRTIPQGILSELADMTQSMQTETRCIHQGIDHLLSITAYEYLDKRDFHAFSVQRCVEDAVKRANRKDIAVGTYCIQTKQNFTAFASYEFLTFVIINLIKNAQDAIVKNGRGDIEITIASDQQGNRIMIKDTGTGIDDSIQPHIFDKFFTTKKRGKHSGIGLAFCQSVMSRFDGSITCESTPGSHTRFTLFFKPHTQCKTDQCKTEGTSKPANDT